MKINHKILICIIILIGALIRASHLIAPHIDSDQAVFGLQGMHVLKGEFPVFSWGYAYIGTLQSYLDALFFYIFGPSRHMLNFVPLFFYAGYAISLYFLSKAVFRNFYFSILTLSLGAIAPDFFILHGIWGRHGYPETFCFGTIILMMICNKPGKIKPLKFYFVLCFIAGLAWWTNFLILYYFVPLVFFIFFNCLIHENYVPVQNFFLYQYQDL